MQLTESDIEKIYQMQKKLTITFKSATSEEQKKRIYQHLKKIEEIISDIENGKSINSAELNIFSDEFKKIKSKEKEKSYDDTISYVAKVGHNVISESVKDSEMDQIYSFLLFFDENFSAPLGQNYLQLEYNLSKKRDTFFTHYDNIYLLLKEYIEDVNVLSSLQSKEQIAQYRARIENQKKYFLVKLSELLHELKDLIDKIISEYYSGINSILNPNDKYINKYRTDEKTEFDEMPMKDILIEAQNFTNDFIGIIRMPDFRNIL